MRPVVSTSFASITLSFCVLAISWSSAALSNGSKTLSVALHPPPHIRSLTINEARAIFSMRTKIWPDGSPITVFVLPNNNPEHNQFVRSLLTLLPHQLKRNWDRLVYTGIGQAPTVVADPTEMLEQLKATPGSIGYIKTGSEDETLHLITLQ